MDILNGPNFHRLAFEREPFANEIKKVISRRIDSQISCKFSQIETGFRSKKPLNDRVVLRDTHKGGIQTFFARDFFRSRVIQSLQSRHKNRAIRRPMRILVFPIKHRRNIRILKRRKCHPLLSRHLRQNFGHRHRLRLEQHYVITPDPRFPRITTIEWSWHARPLGQLDKRM